MIRTALEYKEREAITEIDREFLRVQAERDEGQDRKVIEGLHMMQISEDLRVYGGKNEEIKEGFILNRALGHKEIHDHNSWFRTNECFVRIRE